MRHADQPSTPERIAIAIRDLGKNSGAARNVQEHCRLFRDLGVPVDLYTERFNAQLLDSADATLHRVRRWPFGRSRRRDAFDAAVRRRVRRQQRTLLISHGDVLTRDVLFIHNCTHLAHEVLSGTSLDDADPLGRLHERLITEPELSLLIANSQLMAADLRERFALDPNRVQVLYQSYSPEVFNRWQHEKLRATGRAHLGLPEDQPLAGIVTSGNYRKRNVDGLLRAASLASANIHWLIVGKDSQQHRYENLARELGIAERVHFQPVIPEVECYYHALDAFVLPAHIEEFGRAALEAMACGTPVVLGPRVGCAELLTGRTRQGILADLDPANMAAVVDRMFTDPDGMKAAGTACAEIAAQYDEHRQAQRLLGLLQERVGFPSAQSNADA